uniref:Small ribosomal subunit protein bS6c n=1 Tax=Polysiphonia infestans TaxID=2006978 RepID=A0A1Z1MEN9_9FLOR|nr:ribosomal protein S6 [Polysiphonia infestans]ARW64295.1 ribosomal protein S6 [Polysiphonia infestans]
MNFLNSYETIYVLKPDVTESLNLSFVNHYKTLLKEKGADDIVVQHRGRRHLSYKIAQYYDGIYVQMNYKANGTLVLFLEKSMRFNQNIIRYLTIKNNHMEQINLY